MEGGPSIIHEIRIGDAHPVKGKTITGKCKEVSNYKMSILEMRIWEIQSYNFVLQKIQRFRLAYHRTRDLHGILGQIFQNCGIFV